MDIVIHNVHIPGDEMLQYRALARMIHVDGKKIYHDDDEYGGADGVVKGFKKALDLIGVAYKEESFQATGLYYEELDSLEEG